MFKLLFVCACAVLAVQAAPAPGVVAAYTAPVVAAAPVVTATSHQVIARNYNGLAAVAPVAYTAPVAYSAPLAYSSPLAYSAHPAFAARYVSSPYVAGPVLV